VQCLCTVVCTYILHVPCGPLTALRSFLLLTGAGAHQVSALVPLSRLYRDHRHRSHCVATARVALSRNAQHISLPPPTYRTPSWSPPTSLRVTSLRVEATDLVGPPIVAEHGERGRRNENRPQGPPEVRADRRLCRCKENAEQPFATKPQVLGAVSE